MKKYLHLSVVALFVGLIIQQGNAQSPLFPNSVVSNDIDFILETDSDVFSSLSFIGIADKEMPSSISNELFDTGTFVFEASFLDGTTIEIWCHSSFLTEENAREYAAKLCPRLGKQPSIHRALLDHVVIHNGNAGAFAELEGQFLILYSENMDERISTNDLEETVFHESVHASYQFEYQDDISWTGAQASDGAFITEYAQEFPFLEDMAESALFAYTYLLHPGRLSPEIESWLKENMKNRLDFFRFIYQISSSTKDEIGISRAVIFPNPSNGIFNLVVDESVVARRVEIFNVHGSLVGSLRVDAGQVEIDIKGLEQGVYFISIPGYEIIKAIKI